MKLGLIVSMFDEYVCMCHNMRNCGKDLTRVVISQSDIDPFPNLQEWVNTHPDAHYNLFPNFDTRTPEQKEASTQRFDFGTKGQARNFSTGFKMMQGADVDYVIAILGDTLFLHLYGVGEIIKAMGSDTQVACSRALGQNFNRADCTMEEMSDPANADGSLSEGRFQDETVKDFMPHFWIVRKDMIERMSDIQITNRWCFEQCLGDAIGDAVQYVFSNQAYAFADGVIYNTPSKSGWVHR